MSNVPTWTLPIDADQPCYFRHTFPLNLLSYLQKNGFVVVLPGDLRVSVAAQGGTTVLVSAYIPAKSAFVPVKKWFGRSCVRRFLWFSRCAKRGRIGEVS